MSWENAKYRFEKLKRRYFVIKIVEVTMITVGVTFLLYSILSLFAMQQWIKIFVSACVGIIVFSIQFFNYRLYQLSDKVFILFLNQHYPQLQESADLLLQDEKSLGDLQQIQKLRVVSQFNSIYPKIKLPHHLVRSSGFFGMCFLIAFLIMAFSPTGSNLGEKNISFPFQIKSVNGDTSAISLRSGVITVSPPEYTTKQEFTSSSFDLVFPEGSTITWQLNFVGKPSQVKLLFSGKDSIALNRNNEAQRKISESGFYQFQWRDKNKIHRSDYFKIEVIKDELPKVTVQKLNQFTKVKFIDIQPIELEALMKDDYGLTDALVVATVSKGSGESVKFREEKLRFTSPQKFGGKQVVAARVLDLKKLGLEPGDELYFYVEAWDNKIPFPNHNRTETFFIAVQDTATEITSADSGLGVDLMPEYFRSQRQIIIDTEKLLREKKGLSKKEFNVTSNELGYDQKVLRLRYGQFLGEEDESGIGQEAAHHEEEKDISKQFGHQHDSQNEHNLVEQRKDTHSEKKSNEVEDPVKAFAHQHDNTEEATFFIQSIKAKLKAAVTVMWDAELYLRLYEPDKSLPYQYKALNLLKEISNDSRIYVHRTGFEPPPLKEEKRLSADLSGVKSNSGSHEMNGPQDHPSIRQALLVIERMLQTNTYDLTLRAESVLNKAGQEMSIDAIEKPLRYLKSLSLLKSLVDHQLKKEQVQPALLQIRKSFWQILPDYSPSPNRQVKVSHTLDEEFMKAFESETNE